ncbi:MAG: hypothetical protein A2219_05735 [Elusimicrobia bacterium RIFOXYA2_FULL_50_26]|nr:MAG: hypothetical protein A2219_05735 [Elusimicrobia bacterium RIFOXYA2_FULL_50_26]
MKKIPIKFYSSYEDADEDSLKDALAMKPKDRVAAVNVIRRRVFALKGIKADNRVKRVISYAKRP